MQAMALFKEKLMAESSGVVWDARTDFVLRICMRCPEMEELLQYVIHCADALIREDACKPGNARTLFFACKKTGEEKYRTAIQQVMEKLHANPEAGNAPLSALYETLPFRMAYEMNINRMERVGQTAAAYRSAHSRLWDETERLHRGTGGFSLREEAWFLLALTDGIACCSDQLYEHWRALVDIYRECLSGVLAHLNENGLLKSGMTEGEEDQAGTVIVVWALLTGVEQGLIDPERYLPRAERMLSGLRSCGEAFAADLMEEVFGV